MARRLDPETRREEIVRVTAALIARTGYQRLSLREIARECGMSAPGLMHYFPKVEDLLRAVLEHRDAMDFEAFGSELPGSEGLREFLDRVVQYNSQRPEAARLYAMLQAESLNGEHPARHYFRRRTEVFVDELTSRLEGTTPEPRVLARSIVAVLDGLQLHWLSDPDGFDLNVQWAHVAESILPARPGV